MTALFPYQNAQAVQLMEDPQHGATHAEQGRAFLTLARYADSQYEATKRQLGSQVIETKKELLQTLKVRERERERERVCV